MIDDTAIIDHSHLAGRTAYILVHEVKAQRIEKVECQKIQCLMQIVLHLKRFAFVPLSSLAISLFTVSLSLENLVFTAQVVHSWGLTNESLY